MYEGPNFSTSFPTSVFLIIAILVGMKCLGALLCISLMMNDVKHLFVCFLDTCTFSLEKCLFRYFDHFLVGLFVFLLLNCKSSLYSWPEEF